LDWEAEGRAGGGGELFEVLAPNCGKADKEGGIDGGEAGGIRSKVEAPLLSFELRVELLEGSFISGMRPRGRLIAPSRWPFSYSFLPAVASTATWVFRAVASSSGFSLRSLLCTCGSPVGSIALLACRERSGASVCSSISLSLGLQTWSAASEEDSEWGPGGGTNVAIAQRASSATPGISEKEGALCISILIVTRGPRRLGFRSLEELCMGLAKLPSRSGLRTLCLTTLASDVLKRRAGVEGMVCWKPDKLESVSSAYGRGSRGIPSGELAVALPPEHIVVGRPLYMSSSWSGCWGCLSASMKKDPFA
jgi:hypothetical protein